MSIARGASAVINDTPNTSHGASKSRGRTFSSQSVTSCSGGVSAATVVSESTLNLSIFRLGTLLPIARKWSAAGRTNMIYASGSNQNLQQAAASRRRHLKKISIRCRFRSIGPTGPRPGCGWSPRSPGSCLR